MLSLQTFPLLLTSGQFLSQTTGRFDDLRKAFEQGCWIDRIDLKLNFLAGPAWSYEFGIIDSDGSKLILLSGSEAAGDTEFDNLVVMDAEMRLVRGEFAYVKTTGAGSSPAGYPVKAVVHVRRNP